MCPGNARLARTLRVVGEDVEQPTPHTLQCTEIVTTAVCHGTQRTLRVVGEDVEQQDAHGALLGSLPVAQQLLLHGYHLGVDACLEVGEERADVLDEDLKEEWNSGEVRGEGGGVWSVH